MKSIFIFLSLMTVLQASHANMIIKSFEGSTDGKTTIINWDIESPSFFATANLERSTDGILFTSVKTFELQAGLKYDGSFSDKNLSSGTYFYRLKITKPGYIPFTSNIVTIKVIRTESSTTEYKIVNPVLESISIRGHFTAGRVIVVEVTDMAGRKRMIKEVVPVAGELITVSSAPIAKGWYILRITEKNSTTSVVTKTIYKQQ